MLRGRWTRVDSTNISIQNHPTGPDQALLTVHDLGRGLDAGTASLSVDGAGPS